jgi:hypothetical protein
MTKKQSPLLLSIPHSSPVISGGTVRAEVTIAVDGVPIRQPTQEELERQYRPYALELGKLIFSWNRLQVHLCRLFSVMAGCDQDFIAQAIWHSTPSDLAQRKMLRAAAEARIVTDDSAKNEILWILNMVD